MANSRTTSDIFSMRAGVDSSSSKSAHRGVTPLPSSTVGVVLRICAPSMVFVLGGSLSDVGRRRNCAGEDLAVSTLRSAGFARSLRVARLRQTSLFGLICSQIVFPS
jgi:hypothetical protein